MKSYGGYITFHESDGEYFSDKEYDVLCMNLARNAVVKAVEDGGFAGVYVPLYICESVLWALKSAGIPYETYHIDESFFPILDKTNEDYAVLMVHYFGVFGRDYYDRACNKYKNIIFDNTQSFFEQPVLEDNVYNVYSPRKFFSVCDGGYLIAKHIKKEHTLMKDYSYKRAAYLLKATETGTNNAYNEYLDSEEELNTTGAMEMSDLTRNILGSINYEYVKKRRMENYNYLLNRLCDVNELKLKETVGVSPMIYPLLVESKNLRSRLIDNKIYVSQWWKWVIENSPNVWEEKLSKYLLPIPIDQRLDVQDMEYIAKVIEGK